MSEWRTAAGLPVAVVELAGGEVEHFAALVPATAVLPATVAGWPAVTAARPGALLWSLTVPATVAATAALELATTVATSGCGAVVAVGPLPATELAGPFAGLAAVPGPLAARASCVLADGRDDVLRGSDERVDLAFAVPQPDDPRFDTLPALAAVLERRLAARTPGVHVGVELHDGCWRLVAHLAAADQGVRGVLHHLREAIAAAAAVPVAESELSETAPALRRSAVAIAADGSALAVRLAERLAQGGHATGALVPTIPGVAALSDLVREVTAGRLGQALVTEAERRTRPEEPETLPNGVIISARWSPDEVGILALAFGSLDPDAGRALTSALATTLAASGWSARPGELAGVPVVTAVVPPDDMPAALEAIADAVMAAHEPPQVSLSHDVAAAIGLRERVTADTLSLALALPPEAEEGLEAARKFFSQLPQGGVRSTATPAGPHLAWTPDAAAPRLAAVIELPASTSGWLAGEVVAARASAEMSARAAWMSPAGGLALVLFGEGEAHVPALDARLGSGWARLRRPVVEAELTAAARRLLGSLSGDLAAVTARAAVAPFVPAIPPAPELLAADAAEVNAVLAGLPAWDALVRIARGPAPVVVPPPVRKSARH